MPKRCPSTIEGKLSLAIQAYSSGQVKSLYAAARSYRVPYSSLYTRYHGTPSKSASQLVTRKLTCTKKRFFSNVFLTSMRRVFLPGRQSYEKSRILFS
ncbi:hypothetical protein BS50DRAFT_580554 [Corynespora cassiicola Philippines]|uniref:HTH psq-type domain-containing protein n=1 Tax=Corynespora cassiicola Philippines TaxID=1448308 RepID=A0A2T2MZN5_CORCC|nr:hypothetical protein BS50DRAFT_580554 [Corynespora cassiicola Philippines]